MWKVTQRLFNAQYATVLQSSETSLDCVGAVAIFTEKPAGSHCRNAGGMFHCVTTLHMEAEDSYETWIQQWHYTEVSSYTYIAKQKHISREL
jgi:hypothetical protein